MQLIDVDFSLAMHNRTGKFFIGRDLLAIPGLPLGQVFYWYSTRPPSGLRRRLYGRLQLWQIKANTGTARRMERLGAFLPIRSGRRPLLHIDPFTVPTGRLTSRDIVMCHDLGPLSHPQLFAPQVADIYQKIYDHVARVGPHMVFVSRDTEQQFFGRYSRVAFASTRVIYPTIRESQMSDDHVRPEKVGSRFLLTVGSIGLRKNQARCIDAFATSGLYERGVQYVVCGGAEPGFDDVKEAANRTPGVVMLPYVDDRVLAWLYTNASGFVLVSQLEGFGMPVAEAISFGLVPLVTATGVLQEVAGEGALRANSGDVPGIAERMRALMEMQDSERTSRLHSLRDSIARFQEDAVQAEWRKAFSDWSETVGATGPSNQGFDVQKGNEF